MQYRMRQGLRVMLAHTSLNPVDTTVGSSPCVCSGERGPGIGAFLQSRWAPRMPPLRHLVIIAAVAASLLPVSRPVQAEQPVALGCLSHERIGCGCSIRLTALACATEPASSSYHLHAGLSDGAPLWLMLDGREIELKSKRPKSHSFSFSQGDSWGESYVGNGTTVEVSYRPAPSTCPKQPPETCEYFDVRATVTVTQGKGQPARYEGVGVCGC